MGHLRAALTRVAMAALVAASGTAVAGSPASQLIWNAPPGCPEPAAVEAQIRQLETPGRRPAIASAKATVNASIDGGWHLRLETLSGDARGVRTIDASSCAALAESTALILSAPEPEAPSPAPTTTTAISAFAADRAVEPTPLALDVEHGGPTDAQSARVRRAVLSEVAAGASQNGRPAATSPR
jgi:hypothetical protein